MDTIERLDMNAVLIIETTAKIFFGLGLYYGIVLIYRIIKDWIWG
jgi:hypothetical protein